METMNLPIRYADIEDVNCGMYAISLVSDPAIECEWMAFSKERMHFAVLDDEQHMICGPVVRVDYPILRKDRKTGELYNLIFTKDTAKEMLQRFLRDGYQNDITVEHNGVQVNGIEPREFFIKDIANGISPKGFEDIADGSVFAKYHISNPELWQAVKAGTFKGFSLEAMMNTKESMSKIDIFDVIIDVLTK